ncbi:PREDICTED: methyl-CpG-binding domain-containing protein 13 [Nelumbo nucifera]|uniref:Methyl-CpG-binding domain-containing protein 13 n=1 Tax=Nelumbo nucifera TaxID=4432 RepID=A0A1U8QAW0_NELNU|nr:PREDICTED: methyl-CpG-binding domain-containing protein 13 [Nelumbo nucifera]XP_010273136.1 PREDICTED: methyl-CpG-binding domain-containing protein 13 [Nelumbo nucifera]XP_019055215.1 PREDICTED: methyl-CpG-binding domain-containing protein 13 [Nelumbo nucifera]
MPLPIERQTKMCSRDKDMELVVQMEDPPEWLPAGWVVEIKTRMSGSSAGQKYKCYIAPSTGCKLYSKKEVQRYLSCYMPEVKRKECKNMQSACNVVLKDVTEELPPGWIKEIRVRRKTCKTKKSDTYYIDPVNGYEFRSKKDVFRYLGTGDLENCAIKPKKRGTNDMDSIDDKFSPPTAAKRQKLEGNATRRCLLMGQNSKSSATVDQHLIESSATEECVPLPESILNQNEETMDSSGLPKPEAEGSEKEHGKVFHAENGFISAPAAEVSVEKHSLEIGMQKHRDRKTHVGSGNYNAGKDVPRRASRRLAGLKAEPTSDLDTSNRARRAASNQSGELETNPVDDFTPTQSAKLEGNPVEDFTPACEGHGALKQVGVPKVDPVSESTSCASIGVELPSDNKQAKEGETLLGNQVLIEDTTGKLENEKPGEEKPKSPLILPFGDTWPDPCLEFAFKTLTGAIPVEDTLAIEDYFQQLSTAQNQSNGDFTLPNRGLDSFCQTDFILQFGNPENPILKQQSQVKSTFSSFGNDCLASSGENVLQQPSGGRNKECRKW